MMASKFWFKLIFPSFSGVVIFLVRKHFITTIPDKRNQKNMCILLKNLLIFLFFLNFSVSII